MDEKRPHRKYWILPSEEEVGTFYMQHTVTKQSVTNSKGEVVRLRDYRSCEKWIDDIYAERAPAVDK